MSVHKETAIVFVPGIEGTEMFYHNYKFWPPTLLDLPGYPDKKFKMMKDNASVSGAVIGYADFLAMYGWQLHDMITMCRNLDAEAIPFGYDWRRDIADAARALAAVLLQKPYLKNIRFLCHSMGGLVCRYFLESNDPAIPQTLKEKVSHFVGMCIPNLGAVDALASAFGLQGIPTIDGTRVRELLLIEDFPAGYQLFPQASHPSLFDNQGRPQDIYDPAVQNRYLLSIKNTAAASRLHRELGLSKRPPHVKYFFGCGTGFPTDYKVVGDGLSDVRFYQTDGHSPASGDGRVEPWSSDPDPTIYSFTSAGSHLDVLAVKVFRDKMAAELGAGPLPPDALLLAEKSGAVVSIARRDLQAGSTTTVLVIPQQSGPFPDGTLFVQDIQDHGSEPAVLISDRRPEPLNGQTYRSLEIATPSKPGMYSLSFVGATIASNSATEPVFRVL